MSYISLDVRVDDYVNVEIGVDDVLNKMDPSDILSYIFDEISEELIVEKMEKSTTKKIFDTSIGADDGIHKWLVNEYYRGAFGDFDFDKFFNEIGIKQCQCPSSK